METEWEPQPEENYYDQDFSTDRMGWYRGSCANESCPALGLEVIGWYNPDDPFWHFVCGSCNSDYPDISEAEGPEDITPVPDSDLVANA
jgi:hypothetical protein